MYQMIIIAGLAFGTLEICNTDYLEVYDASLGADLAVDSRRLITRFCGSVSLPQVKKSGFLAVRLSISQQLLFLWDGVRLLVINHC